MKRIILTVILFGTLLSTQAQADSLCWAEQPRTSLDLGLSAGVTLFSLDNEYSPYYSRLGLTLQLPLTLSYRVSPYWRLSSGVRVDINLNHLHYNIAPSEQEDGVVFASTTYGKQYAFTHFGYLGISLGATWYPWPQDCGLLAVTTDLYAGYGLGRHLTIKTYSADPNGSGYSEGEEAFSDGALLPWRLELGITLSTDVLGLLHGVRFFMNLLPTYRDPLSGEDFYLHGMTFYL